MNHRPTLGIDTRIDTEGFCSLKEKFCHELEMGLKLYGRSSAAIASGQNPEVIPGMLRPYESSQKTLPHQKTLAQRDIPLHRVKEGYGVTYISAVALKLEKVWAQRAIEIASHLAADMVTTPDLTVTVLPTAWIHLQLTPNGIAQWLQSLCDSPKGEDVRSRGEERITPLAQTTTERRLDGGKGGDKDRQLFEVQYAHARCCSLLRLAHREGLISVDVVGTADCTTEERFPWLDGEGNLRFSHPAEMAVISQLAGSLDGLWDLHQGGKNASVLPLALGLSQDLLKFYADCRIFGEMQKENLALAKARSGLLLAGMQGLKLLLEKGLGMWAPLEL